MHPPAILILATLSVCIPLQGLAQTPPPRSPPPQNPPQQNPPEEGPSSPPPALPWVTRQIDAPRISFHRFFSHAAQAEVSYHLYTPLAYDDAPTTRFP
ncbi:MAG: hypothetical protein ACKOJF_23270, partial [Planctomycetaceae bacterium]